MRSFSRVIALLTLLGWLFATGHVALRHGGVADGGAHHALLGAADDDDDDDDAPPHDGEHHHHDLAVIDGGQWMKSAEHKTLVPVWVPLFHALTERFMAIEREERHPRSSPTSEHAPPDERASGWLLVCHTALPVRGPSFVF